MVAPMNYHGHMSEWKFYRVSDEIKYFWVLVT